MKFEMLRFLIPVAIILLIDLYSFQAVKTVVADMSLLQKRWIYGLFWLITVLAVGSIITALFAGFNTWPKVIRVYFVGFLFVLYFSKLLIVPFLIIDDGTRLVRWIAYKFSSRPFHPDKTEATISRMEFLNKTALIVAGIPFVTLTYGMLFGAFQYKVRKQKLIFSRLPKAFDGIRILQVSDIHIGSFVDAGPVKEAVKLINDQKADLVFFTGDLVNNMTSEVYPFTEILQEIKAPLGIYAILGNHDYGDYASWDSQAAKQKNMEDLYAFYKKLGWDLLRNENRMIVQNGASFSLAGVENWSSFSRFPKYGDLHAAMKNIGKDNFTILLSHDPTHWDAQVLPSDYNIDLTLAGHTHGMQFGIETPAFRWSPSQYIFKEWAGLYRKNDQYLYVNRGLGFLGYPGRVGIRPEITVFELHTA